MQPLHAVWKDGQIVFDHPPPNWPDGMNLWIFDEVPVEKTPNDLGLNPDSDDPEDIRRWCEALDTIEPLPMTPEEEAVWQQSRRERRERELANLERRSDELRRSFK